MLHLGRVLRRFRRFDRIAAQQGRVRLDSDSKEPEPILPDLPAGPGYDRLRDYVVSLEQRIGESLAWASSERSGEALWSRVRESVSELLLADWRAGKLQGTRPEQGFFVRCDRTTMTEADVENGRLIVLVGVALLRPAEFELLRVERSTLQPRP